MLDGEADVAENLPLFPLGTVLFPGMVLPLHLFEERYRRLMTERRHEDPVFGVELTRRGREVADEPEVHDIGVAASLIGAGEYEDGRWDVIVRGGRRFRIVAGDWSAGYLTGSVEWLEEPPGVPESAALDPLAEQASLLFDRFLRALERTVGEELPRKDLPTRPAERAWALCSRLPVETWERQRLLEISSTAERLEELVATLRREHDLLVNTGIGGSAPHHPGSGFSVN
jgi:uncharacterized protein